MSPQIYIKVLGFSDQERHAINSIFRLSQERETSYSLWGNETIQPAQLLLIDGQSYEGRLELAARELQARDKALQGKPEIKAIWIGAGDSDPQTPPGMWRSLSRPLDWAAIVQALDELFAPAPATDFDFDLDSARDPLSDDQDTLPGASQPRALMVHNSVEKRYFLRAVLALSGWLLVDEAVSASQAQDLLGSTAYELILLDLDLPTASSWSLIEQIKMLEHATPAVLAMSRQLGWWILYRAWVKGCKVTWREPLDSRKMHPVLIALHPDRPVAA
ncbi:MAG: hypothetical protein ACKVOO_12040 [Burkholderiaceae bacterium]